MASSAKWAARERLRQLAVVIRSMTSWTRCMSDCSRARICEWMDVMRWVLAESLWGKSRRTRKRLTMPLGCSSMAPESCHCCSLRTASARGKRPVAAAASTSMLVYFLAVLLIFLRVLETGEASAVRVSKAGGLMYLYSEYLGVIALMSSKRSSSCALRRSSAFFWGAGQGMLTHDFEAGRLTRMSHSLDSSFRLRSMTSPALAYRCSSKKLPTNPLTLLKLGTSALDRSSMILMSSAQR